MGVVSTLMRRSNENKSCMKVDESRLDITTHIATSKLMKVGGQMRVLTLINSHLRLTKA